ncbi:MAG: adenylate/guanylate cyclase domain-containing protein [Dehalococcoidia bacterium]
MEPDVQYARTSDGMNIAYSMAGSGPPLVYTRTWTASHAQLDWQQEFPGKLFEALAAKRTLITFDRRGAGLSDRDVPELTLDAFTLDLEAVVADAGLDRFVLVGAIFGVMVNTIYALRHPERVSAWISISGVMSGRAFWESPRNRAMRAMREADFDTYVETINSISGNPRLGEVFRASITPEGQKAFVDASEAWDVSDLVPQLNLPLLVIYRSDYPMGPQEGEWAREMATLVRGARLVAVPWEPREMYVERTATAIDAFLSDAPPSAAPAAGAVHTILFTDLASSTALTQRLGDSKAQELLRAHNTIVRDALAQHGGSEIKHTGDGIMASFSTASGALECAIAIQRAVAGQDDANLQVHVGLNAGEPVAEDEDLFGTAVQLARRVCDQAQAGEILVSNVVRELAAGKGFLFADRGASALKGFEDPVRLYEVRWQSEA